MRIALLVLHDPDDGALGAHHPRIGDEVDVLQGLLDIVVQDAVGSLHTCAVGCYFRAGEGAVDGARNLEATTQRSQEAPASASERLSV